jgi:uncharacterized protein (DUF58 family)
MRSLWKRGDAATVTIAKQETDNSLFSEELLALTRRLSLSPRTFTPEGLAGEHRSRKRGSSPEFADFKSYSQGDDFRRIDWNIYGRLGTLFVRLSEITTEIPVHILLDASASMLWTGSPERPQKFTMARQIAGLLGYLSLQRSDRVTIVPFSSELLPVYGPAQGRAAVTPMLSYLTGLRADGETNLKKALDRYVRERKRPGFALLISDLLAGEPEDLATILRSFRAHGWEIAVLQIIDPAELDPELFAETVLERGAVDLIDLESRDHIRLALSDDVVLRCREATSEWLKAIEEVCRSEQSLRIEIDTSSPLTETLRRLHNMGMTSCAVLPSCFRRD